MRTLAFVLTILAACVDTGGEPTAPNQLSGDKADGEVLWAGLSSYTIERSVSDPCNNGQRALGDQVILYEEWARTRATVRNICFEVWKPEVTDWDNPDFWRQLDVRVYYRFGSTGAFQWEHVNSIDRRGNNRRYAWSFGFERDPLKFQTSVANLGVPIRIESESNGYAYVSADLELYFTVNGQKLEAPSHKPFTVRYQNYARVPSLAANPSGYVLHDIVSCEQGAARFGSGAGHFAADIRRGSAIAKLGAGLDGSLIYGGNVGGTNQLLHMTYWTQAPVAGQALPSFHDAPGIVITPDGTTMRVEVNVFERATGTTRKLSETFTGCTLVTTN
jgi:hypothetical protein